MCEKYNRRLEVVIERLISVAVRNQRGFKGRDELSIHPAYEKAQGVATTDTSKEYDICLALGKAIMLPRDVVDLAKEDSIKAYDLMVKQYVQARDASYEDVTKGQNKSNAKQKAKYKALQDLTELQMIANCPGFKRVFYRDFYKIAGTPEVVYPDLPEPYSTIILLDFNEEEYANKLAEEEAKVKVEVGVGVGVANTTAINEPRLGVEGEGVESRNEVTPPEE
ncbi:hypothetical protein Acr_25g0000550 [Actinidia rufa]|uniref:Uncharacterized protein n=1 Tax=Actinidia rufa TaxID=165716 RepID=A0A7J0GXW9_9ERIC|nr:hypothetical protein Acr_25g0000550 [Actinidia rufa]